MDTYNVYDYTSETQFPISLQVLTVARDFTCMEINIK